MRLYNFIEIFGIYVWNCMCLELYWFTFRFVLKLVCACTMLLKVLICTFGLVCTWNYIKSVGTYVWNCIEVCMPLYNYVESVDIYIWNCIQLLFELYWITTEITTETPMKTTINTTIDTTADTTADTTVDTMVSERADTMVRIIKLVTMTYNTCLRLIK